MSTSCSGMTRRSFAGQVVRVLGDAALGARLGRAAADLARAEYSWAGATSVLDEVYDRLAAGRRRVA